MNFVIGRRNRRNDWALKRACCRNDAVRFVYAFRRFDRETGAVAIAGDFPDLDAGTNGRIEFWA